MDDEDLDVGAEGGVTIVGIYKREE